MLVGEPSAQLEEGLIVPLRELIDELLFRVRDANQHIDFWTPEERAKAEEELNTIMSRVRGAALHKSQ